jgi:outer membrane lipase/esterase
MQSNPISSLRRSAIMAALAASLLAAGCGSNKTVDPILPGQTGKFVAFGDGLADIGQVGGVRYTVNDTTVKSWVELVATNYGATLTAQSAGGQGWAQGNARVVEKPDAVGGASRTISEQVDAFIASGSLGKKDFLLVDAGISDLVVQANAVKAGSITEAQGLTNVAEAGKALGAVVRRLVAAGAQYVVVAGVYNLGKSPYATAQGTTSFLNTASLKYNEAAQTAMVDLGANVLFVDAALRYNQLINQPGSYGFANSTVAACTTTTAATCTPTTILSGVDYNGYVFADDRYFTPAAQRALGEYAYGRMRNRW